MQIVQYSDITIPEKRQRAKIESSGLQELKESILARGLMHPLVVQFQNGVPTLIAGERRYIAIGMIADDETFFQCDSKTIVPGECPITTLDEALTPLDIQYAELEENVVRAELPWQDRIQALAFIHEMQLARNPEQSLAQTARDLAEKGGIASGGTHEQTLRTPDSIRVKLAEAQIVSKHLDDPAIKKARNATEAYNLVVAKEEKAFAAELLKRAKPAESTLVEVRLGDAFKIVPGLESSSVDLILADPPYGIGADSGGFRGRTVHHHNYEDDPETAKAFLQLVLHEGFRITKPRANLFLFIDIDLFVWIKDVAQRAGWSPFRTPITWGKSDSEGLAPWGRGGFRRTTEWIFYATKGQKGLFHSPIDYLRFNRVARNEREYGPEKPLDLLAELIKCSTLPGDMVLDPCCGSGSTLLAAKQLKRKALGIELDERAYNIAFVKANQEEEQEPELPLAPEESAL